MFNKVNKIRKMLLLNNFLPICLFYNNFFFFRVILQIKYLSQFYQNILYSQHQLIRCRIIKVRQCACFKKIAETIFWSIRNIMRSERITKLKFPKSMETNDAMTFRKGLG